jgi:hypothetical protein
VGGEGNSPLRSQPRHVGAVFFSDDICALDYACALTMGYDPAKIPIVARLFQLADFPLTELKSGPSDVLLNGRSIPSEDLRRVAGRSFEPPPGWRGHLSPSRSSKSKGREDWL